MVVVGRMTLEIKKRQRVKVEPMIKWWKLCEDQAGVKTGTGWL